MNSSLFITPFCVSRALLLLIPWLSLSLPRCCCCHYSVAAAAAAVGQIDFHVGAVSERVFFGQFAVVIGRGDVEVVPALANQLGQVFKANLAVRLVRALAFGLVTGGFHRRHCLRFGDVIKDALTFFFEENVVSRQGTLWLVLVLSQMSTRLLGRWRLGCSVVGRTSQQSPAT